MLTANSTSVDIYYPNQASYYPNQASYYKSIYNPPYK